MTNNRGTSDRKWVYSNTGVAILVRSIVYVNEETREVWVNMFDKPLRVSVQTIKQFQNMKIPPTGIR